MFGVPVSDDPTAEESIARSAHLTGRLTEWIGDRSADQALAALQAEGVVASKVYTAADIMEDETYAERRDIVELDDGDLGPVRMQAAVPRMHRHAGHIWRVGPALGADNQLVYEDFLGLGRAELAELRQQGVI
jgi:formyl-CoA transferase